MKKIIALTLAILSVLCLFAGCGASDEIVLPKQTVEETYENRVAAMLATAWAYYDKNPYIQYGNDTLTITGAEMGNRGAAWMNNTPELACKDRSVFLVCSRYCYASAWHAFDLPLLETWAYSSAVTFGRGTNKDLQPYVIWHHESTGNDAEDLKALEEFFSTLQPGDIWSYERKTNPVGHAGIWGGDLDNDGDPDILHVGGNSYDRTTGEDTREENGAVMYNSDFSKEDAIQFFSDPNAYDYFPKLKEVSILRPAAMEHAEKYPISERAKTRILFPRLAATLEGEKGIYGSVARDGEYTFTLTLKNNSEQKHEGILVQLPTPKNAEIIKVNGEASKNKIIKLNVNLPAGQEFSVSYTVKPTGNVGDIIETGVGYVHAIPLPSLNAVITSGDVSADAVKAAIEENKGKTGDEFLAGYLKSMGMEGAIPEIGELQEALYDRKNVGEYKMLQFKDEADVAEEHKSLAKMIIPEFFGGNFVISESDSLRAKEVRAMDLQAGDILLWQKDAVSAPEVAIHDGTNFIFATKGGVMEMQQWKMDEMYIYRWFLALRPTQGL